MRVALAYGRRGTSVEVPDTAAVVVPAELPGLDDEGGAIAAALRRPLAGPPLDELLRRAVLAIRAHVRTYDLIVRLGGDEFLCVLSEMTVLTASRRFEAIKGALAKEPGAPQIRVGIAALRPEDTAGELVKRADRELPTGSRG